MNVLTPELMEDLETLTDRLSSDESVKGAVLTSGKKTFIAGADIKDMVTVYDRGLSASEASGFSRELNRRLRKLETCGKPIAVAINGLALGGGLEVCLACHYRVLADEIIDFSPVRGDPNEALLDVIALITRIDLDKYLRDRSLDEFLLIESTKQEFARLSALHQGRKIREVNFRSRCNTYSCDSR